ncbi:hypothetical protein BXP70_17155 [Hymenobacter crusticola]|uniref:Uncharacterized protein n=1 Tax=Hymenobacter crusticola TaxID=1770526 RepID=A0A243WAP3_9BACT|nr:hypothetical protein BXP70_17155 [Hymenobacter crusticola]
MDAMRDDNPYKGVSGSPYVVPRWLSAVITTKGKTVMPATPLKYDVLRQRVLVLDPQKGDSLQVDETLIASFVLTDPEQPQERRAFRRFAEAPVPEQAREFVEVLHQGKYTLLKRYTKDVQLAGYSSAYLYDESPKAIEDKIIYYLARPNGSAVPVKLKVRALQTAAPELATALREASRKRSISQEQDAVALLQVVDKP